MAVRATMASLITRTRVYCNDAGSTQFTDQQVQDTLDCHRRDLTAVPLLPDPSFVSGAMVYLDYYSDLGCWEDSMTLQNGSYTTVTPSTTEPLVGHWHFTSSTAPPVFVSGSVYDLHGAAADLLEQYAAAMSLQFDFTSGAQTFRRSQQVDALLTLAKQHRAQAWLRDLPASRPDLATVPGQGGRLDDRGLPWGTGYGRQS